MSSSQKSSNSDAVAEMYDTFSEFHARINDSNLHTGYWENADDTSTFQEATERLTALMIERLAPKDGQRVLDIGCGIGKPAVRLAGTHPVEVVGVTVSPRQIELATAMAAESGLADRVRFERADAQQLPYPDASFDAGWFFESLIHMPDKPRAVAEAGRVLRPGATLVVGDMFHEPGKDWSEMHPLVTAVTLDTFEPLLNKAGFDVLDVTDVTPHILVPEPVRGQLRTLMMEHRAEWVSIAGEDVVRALLDPEVDTFYTPGLGYVLLTARKR